MGWKLNVFVIGLAIVLYNFYFSDNFNPDELKGKNVLVTGASRGLGKGLALQYAKYGANVFITARTEQDLVKVVEECKKVGRAGAKFGYVVADMADYKTSAQKVTQATVAKLGGIDHLVLNHAMSPAFKHWRGDNEDLANAESRIQVNYLSYIHLAAKAWPYLLQNTGSPGRISIMASVGGKLSVRSGPGVCGSKFALDGYFSSLRELFEYENTDTTITYAVVGPVLTEAVKAAIANEESGAADTLLFNGKKMVTMMGLTTVEDASKQIIKATTLGKAELHYPRLFGFIPGGCRLLVMLRQLWPTLLYVS